ncbi:MAG: pyruvate:ferredoxin (flavodoxin) oxidoreductase [Bradyrhizobium sp.]|uniref:pyruvate:ferredoxin (flavodoxin) oxidoreductase n=1 Tax=Bradyrhizobium sp. TaxID=376 RepID=UPI0029B59D34|nr:pyruvate:ferredoxin (flavodoxin) oxidoreductase [Bradyrhizobium sp.]MDX3966871.1 pyruvate:ferredoxin (flavodoxin) oxidoreductase [Bradyrhizobium sp.]
MERITLDGNAAVAHVAYRLNDVCAIYPITPSSPMAELADEWSAEGRTNLWGAVPIVQQMQAEGGAAGAVHGALQAGALTTTFTASQGLLLMLPNMFKIAGELTSCVFHVAARSIATQALSIFGDHSDVMAVRGTGFALLGAASVQEAHDLALVAQAATLEARVPFVHFMDGFRTSHEVNTLVMLSDEQVRAMVDDELVRAHRRRAMSPERPMTRGTAHNPDTFFQARETVNSFYLATPAIVQRAMDRLAELTGRQYRLFRYDGHPEPERVVVVMGSAAETLRATAAHLAVRGERVGVLQVLLYRPWSSDDFLAALPDSVQRVAVLDRTKEPGAPAEPLCLDVAHTLADAVARGARPNLPLVVGGRYGLGSKDFTPAMAKAAFDHLKSDEPRAGFTVGITDDVCDTSLPVEAGFEIEPPGTTRALFFGLGSDGTVGANKNSVKILAEDPECYAQGYFVYDSHKSGAETISHLRFGNTPIAAPYLLSSADFVGVHRFEFLDKLDVLRHARDGATVLVNAPYDEASVWDHLRRPVQQHILEKRLRLFVIDASGVAQRLGLGPRVNTILQTCFFAISGVLPREEGIRRIRKAIEDSYADKGRAILEKNFAAVESALDHLHEVVVPDSVTSTEELRVFMPPDAPDQMRRIAALQFAGRGDEIPVSAIPADGSYAGGTTQYEKRNIAFEVPVWKPELCIQCGQCSIVCPHSVIRAKSFDAALLDGAPEGFLAAPVNARGYPDKRFTLQIAVEDCTGCGLCIDHCPAHDPLDPGVKAINLSERRPQIEPGRRNFAFFDSLPEHAREEVDLHLSRGLQFVRPLFEFSGACAGCGETPYLKLLSQLFGDRLQIANATGCTSIFGGNLPALPWRPGPDGRGPAWSNSLFEDNAEFGFGMRLAVDQQVAMARALVHTLADRIGSRLAEELLNAPQRTDSEIVAQRLRVEALRRALAGATDGPARDLDGLAEYLARRSLWIVGGDGWAYDIGAGGLDHVLAQDRDVNVLVLDTEVYSNTGGQASKATPLGASAKFAAAGKRTPRKDLALQAIASGYVYVAQIALAGSPEQTIQALRDAEEYEGPSLILAYSQCIAHGLKLNLRDGMKQQRRAVASGYWPLFRYDPRMRQSEMNPFRLDSTRPRLPLEDFAYQELRYRILTQTRPEEARMLLRQAQAAVDERYRIYEDIAARDGTRFHPFWQEEGVPSGEEAEEAAP